MTIKEQISVAICGTRGVPANYGGFETFAEELGKRLSSQGFRVIVYCRESASGGPHDDDSAGQLYQGMVYQGMERIVLAAPRHKYLETVVHTARSFLHLVKNPVDFVILCNAANAPLLLPLRLRMGRHTPPIAINVDGIERKRAKWNFLGKAWYRLGERCSVMAADTVIGDAEVIADYYRSTYRCPVEVITYGARECSEWDLLQKLQAPESFFANLSKDKLFQTERLIPGSYILYVSRLEPENNAHVVIDAYGKLDQPTRKKFPLVIVGSAPYSAEYIASLHRSAAAEVRFLGGRYGRDYELLQMGATVYIQATEVGGTHPALVEAMGFGNAIIVNGTPENREVIGSSGEVYSLNNAHELYEILVKLLIDEAKQSRLRHLALERANKYYTWTGVTDKYVELIKRSLSRRDE